jgi:hypothetical protein
MAWDDAIDPQSIQEPATLGELHKRMLKGFRLLFSRPVLRGKAVGAGSTQIAHGQRSGIPRFATVTPRTAVAVGVSAIDATYVYVEAASACTVDILLEMI